MVKMIDRLTGTDMWVAESRVDEYLAAGHKLAVRESDGKPKDSEKPKTKKKK